MPSAEQFVDEILIALAPSAIGGAQELPSYEVSAVERDKTKELSFLLAVSKRLNGPNLGFNGHSEPPDMAF